MRGHLSRPVTVVLCAFAVCLLAHTPSRALDAGAAKVDLALAAGIPLDGDVARRGRDATTVHDPLYVRALYLEDQGVGGFLVAADLFAITPDLRARVIEIAPDVAPAENVVLVATHTFSGPGGLDRSWLARQRGGRFIPELVDAIAIKFAEAMQLAYDARKRCAIGYASGSIALGADRFAPEPAGESRMTVLRVDDSDGNPIAIAANFAALPNIAVQSAPFALSADYPGAFCDALEGMTAAGTVAFFLNGESGNRAAIAPGVPVDWSAVRAVGDALATRAKSLANEITCRELPVRFQAGTFTPPRLLAPEFFPESAPMSVIEVDRLAMVFLPVVPYSAAGERVRSGAIAAGYTHAMTVAPAGGYFGAAAELDRYAAVAERADPVYFGPDAPDAIVRDAVALLPRSDATGPDAAGAPARASMTRIAEGLVRFDEAGSAAERGTARGASLREMFPQGVSTSAELDWLRDTPAARPLAHWSPLRRAADDTQLLVPIASDEARRLMGALPPAAVERLRATSDAMEVPLQRLWLMQLATANQPRESASWPIGVLFSGASDSDGLMIGLTIENADSTIVTIAQSSPRGGRAYVSLGLPWQSVGSCGVNDRGVVIASAPARREADAPLAVPVEALFDEVLSAAESLDEAVALLTVPRDDVVGRVLVGSDSHAVLVESGAFPVVLDMLPLDVVHRDAAAPTAQEARIARLLRGSHAQSPADFERIAADRDRRAAAADHVLGSHTRASVVLVPRAREVRVMVPANGEPAAYHRVVAGGGGS